MNTNKREIVTYAILTLVVLAVLASVLIANAETPPDPDRPVELRWCETFRAEGSRIVQRCVTMHMTELEFMEYWAARNR
jgi:hypothetical protein